jgi:hypothetical protein
MKTPRKDLDKIYGPFRLIRAGEVLKVGEMDEGEATNLAYELSARIEHQDPVTKVWKVW